MTSDPKAPRFAAFAFAAIAVVVATGIPGLVTSLGDMDHENAYTEALAAELPLAVMMAAFGALVANRARFIALLPLAVNVAIDFALGIGLVWKDVASRTGPLELVFGLGGAAVAAIAQTALALLVWLLLKYLARDFSRMKIAAWLLALSVAHVIVKGATGGSVIFGALGAASAAWLALRSAPRAVPFGVVGAIATLGGFVLQGRACLIAAHVVSVTHEAICDNDLGRPEKDHDVLARIARGVSNVDDAASLVTGRDLTLFVLPTGGGALDAPTKAAVEKAIHGARCTLLTTGGYAKPASITVAAPNYVTVDVTMDVTDPSHAEGAEKFLRATFEPRAHAPLIRNQGRGAFVFTPEGSDPGPFSFSIGPKRLNDYLEEMPEGTVLVVGRVIVQPHAP